MRKHQGVCPTWGNTRGCVQHGETPEGVSNMGKHQRVCPTWGNTRGCVQHGETPEGVSNMGKHQRVCPTWGNTRGCVQHGETPEGVSNMGKHHRVCPTWGNTRGCVQHGETPEGVSNMGKHQRVCPTWGNTRGCVQHGETPEGVSNMGKHYGGSYFPPLVCLVQALLLAGPCDMVQGSTTKKGRGGEGNKGLNSRGLSLYGCFISLNGIVAAKRDLVHVIIHILRDTYAPSYNLNCPTSTLVLFPGKFL